MEAYTLVDKEAENTQENEIRVKVDGQVSKYLRYAFRVLNKQECTSLTIRAMGNAIVKALILIELVKRRIGNLHQLNKIYSEQKTDEYRPKYEGMESIFQTRLVTALDCELSKEQLDSTQVGYQVPEPMETRPVQQFKPRVKPTPNAQYNKPNAADKSDAGKKPEPKPRTAERPARGGMGRGRGGNAPRETEPRQRGVGRGNVRGAPRTTYEGARNYQEDERPARGTGGRGAFRGAERARGGRGSMRGGRGDRPTQRRYSDSNINPAPRGRGIRPEGELADRPIRGGHRGSQDRPTIESRLTYAGRGRGGNQEVRGGYEGSRGAFEPRGRGGFEPRGRGDFQQTRGRGDKPGYEGRGRGGFEPREYRGRGGFEGRGRGQEMGDRGRGERHHANGDRQGPREPRPQRGGYGEPRDQHRSYNEPPPVTIVKGGSRGRGANTRGGGEPGNFSEEQHEGPAQDYANRRDEGDQKQDTEHYVEATYEEPRHEQRYNEFRPHQEYKPSYRDDFNVQPPRYQQNMGGESDYFRGGNRGRGRGRGDFEQSNYRGRNNFEYQNNNQRQRYGAYQNDNDEDSQPQNYGRGRGYGAERGGMRMRGGFQDRGRGDRGAFRGYRGGDQERGGYQARGGYRGDRGNFRGGDRDFHGERGGFHSERGGAPQRGRGNSHYQSKPEDQAEHFNSNQDGEFHQEQQQEGSTNNETY